MVALGLVADTLLLPLVARGFIRAVELVTNACVWLALSLSAGMSAWSILSTVGQAIAGVMTSQRASAALVLLLAVGVLAAYGLQRVLGYSGSEVAYSSRSDARARRQGAFDTDASRDQLETREP